MDDLYKEHVVIIRQSPDEVENDLYIYMMGTGSRGQMHSWSHISYILMAEHKW